jgi:hypothetical protein
MNNNAKPKMKLPFTKLHKSEAFKKSRFSRANLVMFAIIFASIGGYLIYSSFAAGFFASVQPENGTLATSATVFNDVNASGGTGVQFGTASASSWPNATNSGYQNAPGYPGSLTTASSTSSTCPTSLQANATYRFCNYPSGLFVGVANITFFGCRFASNAVQDANVRVAANNITFDYSNVEPSAVSSPPVAFGQGYQYGIDQGFVSGGLGVTVDHSNIWGFGNGMQFHSSTQTSPLIVRNTWFHDSSDAGTGTGQYHNDGILSNSGGPNYMIFDHNTIASVGNTQALALQTDSATSTPYDHVTITNNYFSGFGYTVAIGEDNPNSTNITFTGNTFGTDFQPIFGVLYSNATWNSAAPKSNLWRNNKWHIAPGTTWSPATNDGKFWTPNGISATDYSG